MDNFPTENDLKNVVKELIQGRELAKQLQSLFNVPSSSNETRDFLLYKVMSSYDRVLSMLKHHDTPPGISIDSPRSLATSPHTDDSDQDIKEQASRKRKQVRCTQKVLVSPGTGTEGQLDDGHGWRKYGQKDILGASYPRGYYRCTHRYAQGCLATRQVQRSDDDPTIYEITYRGRHTCNRIIIGSSSNNNPPITMPDSQNEDPPENQLPNQNQKLEQLFNIQTSPTIIPNDLDTNANPSFDPFQIPSFSNLNLGNNLMFGDGYDFSEDCLYNLMSPTTPVSNYLTSSPSTTNITYGGLINNLNISNSEINRIVVSTITHVGTPTIDPNSTFGLPEFDPNFSFGGYFP